MVLAAQPATHLSSTPPNSNGLRLAFLYRTAQVSAVTADVLSMARMATHRPAPAIGRAGLDANTHGDGTLPTNAVMVVCFILKFICNVRGILTGDSSRGLRTQTTCSLVSTGSSTIIQQVRSKIPKVMVYLFSRVAVGCQRHCSG